MRNLIVDIGNTVAKLVVFENSEPISEELTSNTALEALPDVVRTFGPARAVVSAVVELTAEAREALDALAMPVLYVTGQTPTPVPVLYRSPATLGPRPPGSRGRRRHVAARSPLLVVDAGTCVTYELVDAAGRYVGGNISPGLDMRLSALREHTARLPLVAPMGDLPAMGYDTETAIRAGVVRGIQFEIEGYIRHYRRNTPTFSFF